MAGLSFMTCHLCRDSDVSYVATHHIGGPEGIRTPDLFIANEARYQLRHRPENLRYIITLVG